MINKSLDIFKNFTSLKSETKSTPVAEPEKIQPTMEEIFFGTKKSKNSSGLYIPSVLHAIRLISETIGSLPVKLYDSADKSPAKDHPAYKIAHRLSNSWTSAGQFRTELTADALEHGFGVAFANRVNGHVVELIRLDPKRVTRKFDEFTSEPYFEYRPSKGQLTTYQHDDILYVQAFNGKSPLHYGANALKLAGALEGHAQKLFASNGQPSGVISHKNPQSVEGGANMMRNIRASYKHSIESEISEPIFLDNNMTYTGIALSSTDAQFLENRHEQINEIARIFGIPPHMLFQLDRATWSNAEQMGASFLQLCLRPWLNSWQAAYAKILLTDEEQDDFYFEFVVDDLQRADAAARAEIFNKLISARVMSPNEVRATMNMPAMTGGDELANPYTSTNTPALAAPEQPKEPEQ